MSCVRKVWLFDMQYRVGQCWDESSLILPCIPLLLKGLSRGWEDCSILRLRMKHFETNLTWARVQWRRVCGDEFVATRLWWRVCGDEFVATSLWRRVCGHEFVATSLWRRVCGHEFVATSLWRRVCRDEFVATRLWWRVFGIKLK